jgi:hypothetical protein
MLSAAAECLGVPAEMRDRLAAALSLRSDSSVMNI